MIIYSIKKKLDETIQFRIQFKDMLPQRSGQIMNLYHRIPVKFRYIPVLFFLNAI